MDVDEQNVLLFFEPHQSGAQQRRLVQFERRSGFARDLRARFRFALLGGQRGQVE
jgi:hypothetical protein